MISVPAGTETQTDNMHITYDPRIPKEFYVYPPATSSAQLEVIYTMLSTYSLSASDLDPVTAAEVIKLDDIYLSPITDWILNVLIQKMNMEQTKPALAAYQASMLQSALKHRQMQLLHQQQEQ